jgi:hypothetical protein
MVHIDCFRKTCLEIVPLKLSYEVMNYAGSDKQMCFNCSLMEAEKYIFQKNPSTLHIWFSFVSHKQLAVDTGVAGYTCVCLYICNAILGGGQPTTVNKRNTRNQATSPKTRLASVGSRQWV